ncbi:MAG TPA: class I SAM-dependent methyltransferase [Candidatus Dormibacteraeota bacterium]
MSSETRARAARWLQGAGVEIGALHEPLSVPQGVTVRYVDRLPTDGLRQHYPELGDAAFAPVSIIGDAHDLAALDDGSVDFVIANHVIEHLDDPIRGLQEMLRVIRGGGLLYLAVPDPRATFDVDRDLTTVDHVVDEFRHGTAGTRYGHYADWVAKAEPHVEWARDGQVPVGAERIRSLMEMDYSIHFHVWRPDSFLAFIVAAMAEAQLEFEPVDFEACRSGDNEYIFVFMKGTGGLPAGGPAGPQGASAESLSAQLLALTNSRSWRLTAPLRGAGSAARRILGSTSRG